MPGITLELDAAGSAIDGTNPGTALVLVSSANGWNLVEFADNTAEQDILYASSVDMNGERVASTRDRNATVTAKIRINKSTAALVQTELNKLDEKIAKIRKDGGTLKATLPSGSTYVADLVAGSFELDWTNRLLRLNLAEVSLTLPRGPYWRGAEQDLGDNVETTLPVLIFTEATVPGSVAALGRLVIDNDVAAAQRALFWGLQSRYYSNAATAALFYEAEACSLVEGALAAGAAGASGGGSNVVRDTTLLAGGAWSRLCTIGTSSTAQTHIGTFRLFARVYVPSTNTGFVRCRVTYHPQVGAKTVSNTATKYISTTGLASGTALFNAYIWVDLGMITLPKASVGSQGWLGWFEAQSSVVDDDIDVDCFALFPVDEGYGEAITTDDAGAIVISSGSFTLKHDGAFMSQSGGFASRPASYEGDHLFVPASGQEARTTRVMVLLQRGNTSGATETAFANVPRMWPSPNIDDLSARLFVTPLYLKIPE